MKTRATSNPSTIRASPGKPPPTLRGIAANRTGNDRNARFRDADARRNARAPGVPFLAVVFLRTGGGNAVRSCRQ